MWSAAAAIGTIGAFVVGFVLLGLSILGAVLGVVLRATNVLEVPGQATVVVLFSFLLGFQALINMGVNMGLLPTKGLTLPLMSYGGSGLLVNFIALAILLRIDWENRQLARGLHA